MENRSWTDDDMGYYLEALIGRTLSDHARGLKNARLVPLERGLAMIPVTDALHAEIGAGDELPRFEKLSQRIEEWARRPSPDPVAYVEAEFFGGLGGQSAVVWQGGERVLGPLHATDAINQALRVLGVSPDGAHDEFDAVELGRHRKTADWVRKG
jgi:hypothetical protein